METKAYPGIKNAILLCVLLLGIQLVAGAILGILSAVLNIEEGSAISGIGYILISLLSFGLVIFIGFRKSKKTFNEVFMFNKVSLNIWIPSIIFMFGIVILSSEIDNVLHYFLPMPQFFQDVFAAMMINEYLIISIILIGILPAFLEEMLFRGLMLNGFKENYSHKKTILITALLFGVIHLNPWQFVTAFIIGLIAAWVCLKIKSIVICVYMHLFNNLLFVFAMKYNDVVSIQGFNSSLVEHSFQPWWFNVIGIVLAAVGAIFLIKNIKQLEIKE